MGYGRRTIYINGQQSGVLEFATDSVVINEGDGIVDITIHRIQGSEGILEQVIRSVSDTAILGQDFQNSLEKVTFADGEIVKVIQVEIIDDANTEDTEFFLLKLNQESSVSIAINDNDLVDNNPGKLNVSSSALMVNEDQGFFTISIQRTDGSDGEVSVRYATEDGTAISDTDYSGLNGTLVFHDGEMTKKIIVGLANDNLGGKDKIFLFRVSYPQGGVILGDSLIEITIKDSGVPPVEVLEVFVEVTPEEQPAENANFVEEEVSPAENVNNKDDGENGVTLGAIGIFPLLLLMCTLIVGRRLKMRYENNSVSSNEEFLSSFK